MLKNLPEKLTLNSNVLLNYIFRLKFSSSATTIDDLEIKHFDTRSSTWWDRIDDGNVLYAMNVLRVPFVRDGLINRRMTKKEFINTSEPLTNLKILDVGCGGGYLSESLARLGCNVVGVDASNDLIAIAQKHAVKEGLMKNLTYVKTSIEEFSPGNIENFDAVVASEVIEHVNDQTRFVNECVKCLKPEGSIFITTLNKTFISNLVTICIAESMGVIPAGTHEYEKFIEPHSLQRLLENNNCCTHVLHGMSYNYFTNNWSWISDTSIFYALHAVKTGNKDNFA